ncbi:MAG: gliding motility-associated lipoprotein GldD [Paraglaciecola sp.]|jgi:gliding motility-associated lipoprotein GldD
MRYLLLLVSAFLLTSCGSGEIPIPKPRSYPRVMYPAQTYESFMADYCPFSFDKSVSATINKEETYFENTPPNECWFDIRLAESLNGSIHFSYYPISQYADFEAYRDQAFKLTSKHIERASNIEEIVIDRPENKVYGIAFDVTGPAASPFQFYLTDSTNHFLRGALYFDAKVNPDSIAPVLAYAKEDIFQLVESFSWK